MSSQIGHDDEAAQHSLVKRTSATQLSTVALAEPPVCAHTRIQASISERVDGDLIHRRLAPALRLVLDFCTIAGLLVGVLGLLLAFGYTQLVASLIVGAVVCVVFGTPLLCVIGIVVFYVWAMTRIHRRPNSRAREAIPSRQTPPIVASEVFLDE